MSGINLMKSSMVVGASVVALTLGACASHGDSGSRYGGVYDYESGGKCSKSASCGAVVTPPVTESRYGVAPSGGTIGGQPINPGVVHADCSQVGGMNCGSSAPAPVYTQPAPLPYVPPVTSTGSHTTSSHSTMGAPVSCPSGTTPSGDGTCMVSSGASTWTGSTTSSISSSSSHGGTVDCPSSTTRANDGTCMMNSGSSSSNVTVYPTRPSTGYVPPVDYTAPIYQPIRK